MRPFENSTLISTNRQQSSDRVNKAVCTYVPQSCLLLGVCQYIIHATTRRYCLQQSFPISRYASLSTTSSAIPLSFGEREWEKHVPS